MLINEIRLIPNMVGEGDPTVFRVGQEIIEGGHVVEKINYHPTGRLFNKGLDFGVACYAVYFEGIPERRLIGEKVVYSAEVVKDTRGSEANIQLPD